MDVCSKVKTKNGGPEMVIINHGIEENTFQCGRWIWSEAEYELRTVEIHKDALVELND